MKIGVLTSSRADYGIYRPLLQRLSEDPFFDLNLLVFGTHLSEKQGYTVSEIENDGYNIAFRLNTAPHHDSPEAISRSMAKTTEEFSNVWPSVSFDVVMALGDRYEMFAAVASSVPFNIPVAHIHGGETTLGAFDNAFRHSITHFSTLHFASCEQYRKRVVELTGNEKFVYNAGALCIDSLKTTDLLSTEEFFRKYSIDLRHPTILLTFHPETKEGAKNIQYIEEVISVIQSLNNYQIVITMPNSDTFGLHFRKRLTETAASLHRVHCVESLGSQGYYTCLKHCRLMLGNSSSGFTEALFFNKPVVNIGNRQSGRVVTPNILMTGISKDEIREAIVKAEKYKSGTDINIFGSGNTSAFIIDRLKEFYDRNI